MKSTTDNNEQTVLRIEDLHTAFPSGQRTLAAVNGINLTLARGKILALVGESGCGKTLTALSILRLVPPPGRITQGKIIFNNRDLLSLSEKQMQKIRGKEISLIFQEPGLALNPVYTIGNQIGEVIKIHQPEIKNINQETLRLLKQVKIPAPEHRLKSYPHQLSGGMQQRALIAMAIACRPRLLIADEPTTALDVTIQAQILQLLKELTQQLQMSVLLITHDLGIVAEVADAVAIMYAGKIVEYTNVYSLFKHPRHPYTQGLLQSIPRLDVIQEHLPAIPGRVPDLIHLPAGCPFHPRCALAIPLCQKLAPQFREIANQHWLACDVFT